MQKCLFSKHIPKSETDSAVIAGDLRLFNRAVHRAFVLNRKDKASLEARKGLGLPDRRLKENRALLKDAPPSTHMRLKEEFGMNDYFANSANQAAKGVLRGVKELRASDIKKKEKALTGTCKKLEKTRMRLSDLEKTKGCCIALSRWEKAAGKGAAPGKKPALKMPKGNTVTLERGSGRFLLWKGDATKGTREIKETFDTRYLFEARYLDPQIKMLRHRIRSLEGKVKKAEAAIRRLKGEPSVCFGGKDLFRKQDTVYAGMHDTWKRAFGRRRNSGFTISGRSDSPDGNFVFRYDTGTHTLRYRSVSGKDVLIPGVTFPYGQELVDAYIREQAIPKKKGGSKAPIAWRIEDHGGSWVVKCTLTLTGGRVNDCCSVGCIGMDTNTDCLAVSETDGSGNLLRHRTIPFSLEGLSSGQALSVLSNALEEVFRWCSKEKKPFAMERLSDVASGSVDPYGDSALNKRLSGFAHAKITELAISKGFKYGVKVEFVNSAFTSQMGKVKYMSRYGLSVHEAASLVIARRAQGMKEKLPAAWRALLPEEKAWRHHWAHWRYFHNDIKKQKPSAFYRRVRNEVKHPEKRKAS